eukprot:scaffold8065_cov336-Prasinococcus_capsulatus_cf.AAC.2
MAPTNPLSPRLPRAVAEGISTDRSLISRSCHGQMQTIITRALDELEIDYAASRRCAALLDLLQVRSDFGCGYAILGWPKS